MSLLSSHNLALPAVLTVLLVLWKLSVRKDKVCTLCKLSDECRFLTCAPGSLSATLLHLWRLFSLQTIALKPRPLLYSFSFSPLKCFRGLCWNKSFIFFLKYISPVHYPTCKTTCFYMSDSSAKGPVTNWPGECWKCTWHRGRRQRSS